MKNTTLPDTPLPEQGWSPNDVGEPDVERQNSFFRWWYSLTALKEVPANASFFKREEVRKSRLLSNVLFFYVLVVTITIPACLFVKNPLIIWVAVTMLLSSIVALLLNRQGRVLTAGIVVVVVFELSLTAAIFTTVPLDEPSIQIYDLYIITELLAVSLLPARSIFIAAVVNTMLVLASLVFQLHTPGFARDLHAQFLPIMIRPIILFIIVAGVAYVWVYSTSKAVARADRAEMIAKLEHTLVEQKRDLESGIEHILQTHVAVANGNLNARAPLTQDNSLWQIARALNTLLIRLQRAVAAEKELYRVEQAVSTSIQLIYQAEQLQQVPRLVFTHTAIDPLVEAVQGKTIGQVLSPHPSNPSGSQSNPISVNPSNPGQLGSRSNMPF